MRFVNPELTDEDHGPRKGKLYAVVPPPVKPCKIPGWLKARLKGNMQGESMLNGANVYSWLDHWGSATENGVEYFVSEPYPMGLDTLKDIIAFCERFGLEVRVEAASHHYPTHTLRLLFYPKKGRQEV